MAYILRTEDLDSLLKQQFGTRGYVVFERIDDSWISRSVDPVSHGGRVVGNLTQGDIVYIQQMSRPEKKPVPYHRRQHPDLQDQDLMRFTELFRQTQGAANLALIVEKVPHLYRLRRYGGKIIKDDVEISIGHDIQTQSGQ